MAIDTLSVMAVAVGDVAAGEDRLVCLQPQERQESGGGSGGGSSINGAGGATLVSGVGSSGTNSGGAGGNSVTDSAANTGAGGNSVTDSAANTGTGGSGNGTAGGGGGGGFGGAAGGSASSGVGSAGDTTAHYCFDTSGSIYTYLSQESILRNVLTNYPGYGSGNDLIDGGAGSNELFGLGGSDTFQIDSADAGDNRIWDLTASDVLTLKTSGATLSSAALDTVLATKTVGDFDGDGNSDDITLTFEGHTIKLINLTYVVKSGTDLLYCSSDPLVLDLTGQGIHLTSTSEGVLFDINGDGTLDQSGWFGADNGVLVLDRNNNGRIDDIHELISDQTFPGVWSSLAALATLDQNHDGRIDAADTAYNTLQVWVDRNQDGISSQAELFSLAQLGITTLGLDLDKSGATKMAGNQINGYAKVTFVDGHQTTMAEVQFDHDAVVTTPLPTPSAATTSLPTIAEPSTLTPPSIASVVPIVEPSLSASVPLASVETPAADASSVPLPATPVTTEATVAGMDPPAQVTFPATTAETTMDPPPHQQQSRM
ncbi:MAG: hypothetical protein HQL65_16375 [Magnetococcales bacterium]|nr:hypothetical protein [Magnetococcales bacterium]